MIPILNDLLESPQRRLSLEKEKEVRNIYRRNVRQSSDPFKRSDSVKICLNNNQIHTLFKFPNGLIWLKSILLLKVT